MTRNKLSKIKILQLILSLLIALLIIILFKTYFFSIFNKNICEFQPFITTTIPKIKNFPWKQTALITLWFDDAYASQGSHEVLQLMDEYQIVGAISVPTTFICKPGYLSWNQLIRLQQKGWEVVSHGTNHYCKPYRYNDITVVISEIKGSQDTLVKKGLRADHFVMPCDLKPVLVPLAWEYSKKVYKSYRRAAEQINPIPVSDAYNLYSFAITNQTTDLEIKNLLESASLQKGWLILVFHRIDHSKDDDAITFEKFAKLLKNINDANIPIALPSQVLNIR
ncbi:MAG: polysaccharide deacetylase family protein [Gammaproteobacteria bacterium]|nr:polysaccharide deacetylase family protein [Gammaproteobacteria bacterium]